MYSVEQKVFLATLLQIARCYGRNVAQSCVKCILSVVLVCATVEEVQVTGQCIQNENTNVLLNACKIIGPVFFTEATNSHHCVS
jgi:hypothetical protein